MTKTEKQEKKHGGKRTASEGKKIGRPPKEPTKIVGIRVLAKDHENWKRKINEFYKKEKNVHNM